MSRFVDSSGSGLRASGRLGISGDTCQEAL